MSRLPLNEFIATGFYFSVFLFCAAAFLLAALYKYRWKSELLSLSLWTATTRSFNQSLS